jgi:hypothetical protein
MLVKKISRNLANIPQLMARDIHENSLYIVGALMDPP